MKLTYIYILLAALLLSTACVNDTLPEGGGVEPWEEKIPLRLSVAPMADVEVTRGTSLSLDNLASGTEIGVFVMGEKEYNALLWGSAEYEGNVMTAPYSYDAEEYNANNVKFTVGANGSLTSEIQLYYSSTMGTVVFAYAPYDENMTKERLFTPETVSVDTVQSTNDTIIKNDLLLGTPVEINGVKTKNPLKPANHSDNYTIKLDFRHQYARMVLKVDRASMRSMNEDAMESAQTINIYACNVPVMGSYRLGNDSINFQFSNDTTLGEVLMAKYDNSETIDSFMATTIVVPTATNARAVETQPRFRIEFEKEGAVFDSLYLSVNDTLNVVFNRGESKVFSCTYAQTFGQAFSRGGKVTLFQNVELIEPLTLSAGKTLSLDLNGHSITQTKECTGSYGLIVNDGELTISNSAATTESRNFTRSTGEQGGSIILTDSGKGGGSTWDSYNIINRGTLVVNEGVTIEHKGSAEKEEGSHPTNIPIHNYAGKVTINGGNIISSDFCSLRDFTAGGEIVINGGKFTGQVWMHGQGEGSSSLTITGGEFEPLADFDQSSVFLTNNVNDIVLSVTGGKFNGKIGCSESSRAGVKGKVEGGLFSASAKENTNSELFSALGKFVETADANWWQLENSYSLSPDTPADPSIEALGRRRR